MFLDARVYLPQPILGCLQLYEPEGRLQRLGPGRPASDVCRVSIPWISTGEYSPLRFHRTYDGILSSVDLTTENTVFATFSIIAKSVWNGESISERQPAWFMSRELIRVEGVDRAFGPVTVLEDINLMVNEGDRIGIVGHNGAGKTTLLNTISEQKQDVGEIEYANGIRIAYLTQIRDIDDDTFEDDTFLELSLSGIEETVIDRIKYLQDKVWYSF